MPKITEWLAHLSEIKNFSYYYCCMVTYERNRLLHQKHTIKFENTKRIEMAEKAGFPNCKGLYPDCPEKPDKEHPMCKTCVVLDEDAESSKD